MFADVALMECSDFMQQLRSFKPQSLGSIVARRKSSTTLIFPLPPQACSGKETNNVYELLKVNFFFPKILVFALFSKQETFVDKLRLIFHVFVRKPRSLSPLAVCEIRSKINLIQFFRNKRSGAATYTISIVKYFIRLSSLYYGGLRS